MLKQKFVWSLIGFCILYFGCDHLVTQEDIKSSVYTILRGYESSTKHNDPEISQEYSNAANLKYISKDRTIINDVNILIRENNVSIKGVCSFSEYEDPYSGYIVEGELEYKFTGESRDSLDGEFYCFSEMSGGKIKTLEFFMEVDSDGNYTFDYILANDKEVVLDHWDALKQFLNSLDL